VPRRASAESRRRVRVFVQCIGPGVGLPRLQAAFAGEARREIACLLASLRNAYLRTASYTTTEIRWQRAGAAWAIDYTRPDARVENGARAILAVRDLASGYRLLELPAQGDDAATTVAALEALFLEHGAPLVLKSDNGGHFIDEEVRALLERWRVLHLLSPVRSPAYNGSIESAIGWSKESVAYIAERNGHADLWTAADIEEARCVANDTLRPRGVTGPTPAEAWRAGVPIEDGERNALRARAAAIEGELLASGVARSSAKAESARQRKARRDATRRAADEYGILTVGRRRIRLTKRLLMRARIP